MYANLVTAVVIVIIIIIIITATAVVTGVAQFNRCNVC